MGPGKRFGLLSVLLALAGCSGDVTPAPGKWTQDCNASINGNVVTFPNGPPGACYVYTGLGVVPKVGQTLSLNFSLDGNPDWVQNPQYNPPDTNPPTIHLFLYRNADNGSCAGAYNFYRLFAARTNLVLGDNQTVSAPLTASAWTGCYGPPDPISFSAALGDLYGAGVTFGGQSFAGHGVYVSSGSATFKINSFTAQ